jgi:hypothetical protein
MGLIFKSFKSNTFCKKCDTYFIDQSGAFSELGMDRPVVCSQCKEEILSPARSNTYYALSVECHDIVNAF